MNPTPTPESWTSGSHYEAFMGRWSRLVAREFLGWLAAPPAADWLDAGCGTGALTEAILAGAAPNAVVSVDRSPDFIAYARAAISDKRVTFRTADVQSLPLESRVVDVAVSGLVFQFLPQPQMAAAEMARVARPGGLVAAYVWDYAGGMAFIRAFWDAAAALDPAARELDQGRRFTICHPAPLAELFTGVGLRQVETRPIDIPTTFRDFDDYWSPFLGGQGSAPGYLKTLDEPHRAALKERIRAALPVAEDGAIHLPARAWAVRGRV